MYVINQEGGGWWVDFKLTILCLLKKLKWRYQTSRDIKAGSDWLIHVRLSNKKVQLNTQMYGWNFPKLKILHLPFGIKYIKTLHKCYYLQKCCNLQWRGHTHEKCLDHILVYKYYVLNYNEKRLKRRKYPNVRAKITI